MYNLVCGELKAVIEIERLPEVTDKQWKKINKWNRDIVDEFLGQQHLSPETLKQYKSTLRQFFCWVKNSCDNKPLHELKPRDALKYQNFLIERGLSNSAVKLKRSSVSSLCGFVELYYDDEFPLFRNIFSKKIPALSSTLRHEKQPLTQEELDHLVAQLEKDKEWQMLAYLKFSFETGARRGEVRQLKKEIIDYNCIKGKNYYVSHEVRGKGRGREGKKARCVFSDYAMEAVKKWIQVRGEDDCEYVFIRKHDNSVTQVSLETFNYWCKTYFSDIVGRRVYPHLIRSSRATILDEKGVPIGSIQKLLSHENPDTTSIYIVKNDSELLDSVFE